MVMPKEQCIQDRWYAKPHMVTCRYCGIKFKAPGYRKPKYCSRAHYLLEIHPHVEAQPDKCEVIVPKKEEPKPAAPKAEPAKPIMKDESAARMALKKDAEASKAAVQKERADYKCVEQPRKKKRICFLFRLFRCK